MESYRYSIEQDSVSAQCTTTTIIMHLLNLYFFHLEDMFSDLEEEKELEINMNMEINILNEFHRVRVKK